MKMCSKCGKEKELIEFKKHKTHRNGIYSQCKQCVSEYRGRPKIREMTLAAQRKRYMRPDVRQKNKNRSQEFRKTEFGKIYVIDSNLKRSYGIGIEEYNRMFSEQNGKCAICEAHQSEFNKRLHVDHDHKNGKIRALLCHFCNTSLGGFGEDFMLLEKAAAYLKKYAGSSLNLVNKGD